MPQSYKVNMLRTTSHKQLTSLQATADQVTSCFASLLSLHKSFPWLLSVRAPQAGVHLLSSNENMNPEGHIAPRHSWTSRRTL